MFSRDLHKMRSCFCLAFAFLKLFCCAVSHDLSTPCRSVNVAFVSFFTLAFFFFSVKLRAAAGYVIMRLLGWMVFILNYAWPIRSCCNALPHPFYTTCFEWTFDSILKKFLVDTSILP